MFSLHPASLWIPFTLVAALSQTFRNLMQRGLIASPDAVGAAHIRFIFGLPFAILLLGLARLATGTPIPWPGTGPLLWTAFGTAAQFVATALMLATMRERSFVVTTAFTKTEPVQVAVFAFVFLHEHLRPVALAAIVVATVGVLLASWPADTSPCPQPSIGAPSRLCPNRLSLWRRRQFWSRASRLTRACWRASCSSRTGRP